MGYLEDLESAIIGKGVFRLVPGRTDPLDISFLPAGKVRCAGIDSWSVEFDYKKGWPKISLFQDGKIKYRFWLNKISEWNGYGPDASFAMLAPPLESFFDWSRFSSITRYKPEAEELSEMEVAVLSGAASKSRDLSPYITEVQRLPDKPDQKAGSAIVITGGESIDDMRSFLDSLVVAGGDKFCIYAFIDKPLSDGKFDYQDKITTLFEERFTDFRIINRPLHFGVGCNMMDAYTQIFDVLGYDRALFFDDSLRLSSSYLEYTVRLSAWADSLPNIWAVQGWAPKSSRISGNPGGRVVTTYTDLLGYCMTRKAWNIARPHMQAYETLFLGNDSYEARDHAAIENWMRVLVRQNPKFEYTDETVFPPESDRAMWRINFGSELGIDGVRTGVDGVLITIMDLLGQVRLCPLKSRSAHAYLPSDKVTPSTISADMSRKEFSLEVLEEVL